MPMLSILDLPDDESLRQFFLALVEKYQLLDEQLQQYTKNMAKSIAEKGFSLGLFNACFPKKVGGVSTPSRFQLIYVALCNLDAWQAILSADKSASLIDFAEALLQDSSELDCLQGSFRRTAVHVFAKVIAHKLIARLGAQDEGFECTTERIAAEKAAQLLKVIIDTARSESWQECAEQEPIEKHCIEFFGQKEDKIIVHAKHVFYAFQKDLFIVTALQLCQLGVRYAFSYFNKSFNTLLDLLLSSQRSIAGKVHYFLACAAIYSFYNNLLQTREIFDTQEVESNEQGIFNIIIMDIASAYCLDHSDPDHKLEPIFSALIKKTHSHHDDSRVAISCARAKLALVPSLRP